MSTLRQGLLPPRREMPADDLARLQAYLDGQSRIHLAAWATHDHGADAIDDHVLLGVDDADLRGDDAWALEFGLMIEVPHPHPGWVDPFAMSEAETVKAFADVVWERHGEPSVELDPLDFRFTWEPLDVPASNTAAFRDLVAIVRGLVRVEAGTERLWKNGNEMRCSLRYFLDFDHREPRDFDRIGSALREAGIPAGAMSAGLPREGQAVTAVLYER